MTLSPPVHPFPPSKPLLAPHFVLRNTEPSSRLPTTSRSTRSPALHGGVGGGAARRGGERWAKQGVPLLPSSPPAPPPGCSQYPLCRRSLQQHPPAEPQPLCPSLSPPSSAYFSPPHSANDAKRRHQARTTSFIGASCVGSTDSGPVPGHSLGHVARALGHLRKPDT